MKFRVFLYPYSIFQEILFCLYLHFLLTLKPNAHKTALKKSKPSPRFYKFKILTVLKRQCHKIFASGFFHKSSVSKPLTITLKGIWHEIFYLRFFFMNQFSPDPWISYWGHLEFLLKLSEIFTHCFYDSGDKLFSSVNNTNDILSPLLLLLKINYHSYRWHRWLSLVPNFHQFH